MNLIFAIISKMNKLIVLQMGNKFSSSFTCSQVINSNFSGFIQKQLVKVKINSPWQALGHTIYDVQVTE